MSTLEDTEQEMYIPSFENKNEYISAYVEDTKGSLHLVNIIKLAQACT
jgi:hypothetical protein